MSNRKKKVPYDVKQVIVMRNDLNMRKGKACAQAAHASMKFLCDQSTSDDPSVLLVKLTDVQQAWIEGSFAKVVVRVDSEQELRELMGRAQSLGIVCRHIIDAGNTEFHGVPTLTCASFGPDERHKLDELTGHLKLW